MEVLISADAGALISLISSTISARNGGADLGGVEAAESVCARAEEALQGDERTGEEAPQENHRHDQGAHGQVQRVPE